MYRASLCLFLSVTLSSSQEVTFSSNTQLVIETVSVKDKSGNPIEGLTAKDFVVTENGVAQTVRFFEYQKVEGSAPEPEAAIGPVIPLNTLPRTSIAPERPGDVR